MAPEDRYELALDLLERLVDDDPITRSQEGLDDGCFFCGAWENWDGHKTPPIPQAHFEDCAWIEAMDFLQRPHPQHVVDETRAFR